MHLFLICLDQKMNYFLQGHGKHDLWTEWSRCTESCPADEYPWDEAYRRTRSRTIVWPDTENRGDFCEKRNGKWVKSDHSVENEMQEKECRADADCPSKYMLKNKLH